MQFKKHEEVKNYILNRINSNIYRAGQMIDSENCLAEQLNVSRVTIRKALESLVHDGILYKVKGKGTYVRIQPKYASYRCGVGFSSEIRKRSMTPSSRQVHIKKIKADSVLAQKLQIEENAWIWEVKRLRCADDIPINYGVEYYIEAQIGTLTEQICSGSIYDYLETMGITFSYGDQILEAVAADAHASELLNIPEGYPLIHMQVIAYMKNGAPFNCGDVYYRTDQFQLLQTVYKN